MHEAKKIAIIGDFNFTYNSHHATNLAIEHSQHFLEQEINHYWLRIQDAATYTKKKFEEYDGIWVAPGPYSNIFYLQGILSLLVQTSTPCLVTGEAYKILIEVLAKKNGAIKDEKIISDNLLSGTLFEAIEVRPISAEIKKAYLNHNTTELSSCLYSIYPKIKKELSDEITIAAENTLEEAVIISLKNHPFFLACMFIPQISSTREIPHPLVNQFITACK